MPGAQPPQYAIVSVDRALQVLLMLEQESVRVSDVAELIRSPSAWSSSTRPTRPTS